MSQNVTIKNDGTMVPEGESKARARIGASAGEHYAQTAVQPIRRIQEDIRPGAVNHFQNVAAAKRRRI